MGKGPDYSETYSGLYNWPKQVHGLVGGGWKKAYHKVFPLQSKGNGMAFGGGIGNEMAVANLIVGPEEYQVFPVHFQK